MRTKKNAAASAIAGLALVVLIAGCHPQRPPASYNFQVHPGPDCLASCDKQYKTCAYGSDCMMYPECEMEFCAPQKQECERGCAAAP